MQRDNRADFYKGMLMWGVIWGHLITCYVNGEPNDISIHWIFRTYDMPFFMVLSGFFLRGSLNRYTLKELLLNKVTTILVPTLLWSLISSKFHSITGYYFLWAVFWSSIIVIVIDKIVARSKLRGFILFFVACGFYFIDESLANLSYLFPFFVLGYYCRFMGDYKRHFNISIAIFVFLLSLWSTGYTIWNVGSYILAGGGNLLLIIIFRMVIGATGIITVKNMLDILYNFYSSRNGRFFQLILDTGRETFAIYILHSIVIGRLLSRMVKYAESELQYNWLLWNEKVMGYIIAPLSALAMMYMLCCILQWLKQNKYMKMMFGFKVADFNLFGKF